MKKKDENENKETLFSLLVENNEDDIQDFLLRNGKKKSYCPIYFKKDPPLEDCNKDDIKRID